MMQTWINFLRKHELKRCYLFLNKQKVDEFLIKLVVLIFYEVGRFTKMWCNDFFSPTEMQVRESVTGYNQRMLNGCEEK